MNKLNKHLSKIFILCLSLGVLLFAGSCNSWMSNDDFMSKIESEVHDANASAIQVYVRYANSKMGTSEPSGYTTMKVDVAAELSAVTSDDYGFVKWAAFSTNDFPTSQQHSNLFYETAEKYEENFKPLELPESEVFFSNPTEPTTTVKIYKERNDVFIIPVVAKRPTIVTSVPTNGSSDVVRNTSIRILFSKEMDPASFADEFGNSNIVVTSGSAVLTEAAGDLSAKDITANLNISLGKTGKMLTIAPKSGYYFDNNSQITVNIYEEVCDTDGFELNGKISFSFTTGVKLDSLAPRIEELYASPAEDFSKENRFEQYYYLLQGEAEPVFKTQIDAATNTLQDFVDFDAKNWETDPSKPAKYKKPILKQRVTRYLNIYVRANDIAGSGGNIVLNNNTLSESSVAAIQIRACLYVNASGDPVTTSATAFKDNSNVSSDYYLEPIQIGYAPGLKDSECKIQDTFENVMGDSVSGGTLFTYDLEGLPDGLIKIDIWAVDMVGNSGDTESYVKQEYNNNYRSIFVVKDTTKPDAEANKKNVLPDLTAAVNTDWFNATTYDAIKIQPNTAGNTNSLKDAGHSALVCEHDKLKWIVKPTADTNWVKTISKDDSAWKPVTQEYSGFTRPSSDGPVTLTYALMDDLGNISDAVAIQAFNYDATLPSFNNLSWTAETGSTPGIAKENELATQTLVIPLKEITAGLKTVELTVAKGGLSNQAYGNSFEGTGLSVKAGETSLTKGTDYTVSGNILTFNTAQTGFDTNLTIKGIKISDEITPDALEGNYAIQVKATDAANNSTTTTVTQNTSVSIDSTKPIIQKIFIPNIRKAVRFEDSGNTPEYWIDYTKLSSLTGYTNPITNLEVTFNESNSGALVFDFSNSTVKLTSGSELYKGNTKISADVNENAQTLTIKNPADAIRNDPSAGSVKVQIKNAQIQLDPNNDAKVDIKISDTATNLSNSFNSVTSSEGATEIPGIGKFKYDKESISSSYYTLTDKETEANCDAAEDGYTNNAYINAKITLGTTTKASGVYSITIDGPAEFDSTTTIKNSSNQPLTFDISDDKKTATFYKEVSGVKTHMLFNNAASSGKDVNIYDLKLTGGEGSKSITLKAGHLSGVVNSSETQTIVLDTTPPEWVGKGLYVSYSSEENAKKVYPHPDPDSKVKVYGMDFGTKNTNNNLILYFYDQSSYSSIVPDVSDDNLADTFYWKKATATSYATGTALSNSAYTGHLMVYAKDKAGNKSSIIDFYRQPVSSLRAGLDALEHNAELIPPDTYTKDKNTFLNSHRVTMGWKENTYVYWGSQKDDKIWVINYILKKAPAGQNYKLKIDVSPYANASSDEDEPYAPIEYYGITTIYGQFPSTKLDTENHVNYHLDPFVPEINRVTWRDYNTKNTTKTDYQIDSIVDDSGDIILTLPNHDLPPISLFLKDGVGNTKYIILNPGLKAKLGKDREVYESVGWFMDDKVGSFVLTGGIQTNYNDVNATDINSASSDYVTAPGSDVAFYKQNSNNTYLVKFGGTNGFSDTCRFSIDSSSLGSDTVYSMRSRILAWTGDSAPDQSDFESATGSAASDWYSYMEKLDSGNFKLQNYLPKYDSVDPNGYGLPYKLYYIIEDRVGNCEIRQLKYNNVDNWLYDNVEPTLDVKTSQFVNNIDNKNYYSDTSTVKYEIVDKMSGIKNKGTGNVAYPGFENRETEFAKEQGENIKNLEIDGSTIYIKDVEDYAGNKAGAVGLSYEGSTEWVYQPNPPAFASSSPVQITAENPNGKRFETGSSNGEWYIDSSRWITHIQLKMTMADNEPLLGWIIKKDDSVPENKIYTVADTQSQNGNPAVLTPIPHSGKVYTYSIDKTKKSGNQTVENTNTTWNDYFNQKPLKFYAVNRAGIINPDPIVINFKKLPVPALDGSLEYSDVIKYPSSDSTDNYIKSASKVIFKTKENPDKCTIFVGSDSVTFTLSTYLNDSTGKYEIPLGTNAKLKAASGAALKLVLSITGGEDSDEIELKGPANVNKWTFDETSPTISLGPVKTVKNPDNEAALKNQFDNSDEAYYIEGDNAIIEFNTSATDIAKWQKKLSTQTDYEDIDNTSINGNALTLSVTNATYNFRAVDKAGNASSAVTVEIKKDVSVPLVNSFSYELRKGDAKATDGTYTDTDGTIVYNKTEVNKIYLNLTGISDPDGNGLHFFNNDSSLSTTTSNGVTYATISLSLADGASATYAITVKDDVGKSKDIKTFTVKADDSTPSISISSVQSKTSGGTYDGYLKNSVYYLCRKNAIITLSSGAQDIATYQVNINDAGWNDITPENGVYTFSCEGITTATTYAFHAIDNVGHVSSSVSATIVYDGAGPTGSVTHTVNTSSGTATAANPAANPIVIGDYTASEPDADGVITITYNSNVKTIVFDDSGVSDEGAGYTSGKLFYKKGSNGSVTEITNKTLSLENDMGTDIYEIIAKDNTTGNSGTVGKYKFVKDTTGPAINTGVYEVDWNGRKVNQVNGYTSTIGTIPYAKWVSKDQRKRASYYTSGTKLMFAKTAISGAIQYQMVQTVTTGNTKTTDGYTATAGNTWQNMVVSDDGNSFVFALPDIHTPYTRLSLFFRDELGNVSDAYYLGNNTSGQQGIQWWIIGGAIKAGDTTITSITWNNNGTATNGWGGKLHDYTVTLTLPVGTLIKSVFLVPKPGNANTGVVFSTNLPQGVNTSLQFSGYGTETDVVENNGKKEGIKGNYDSEGFLVLPSSSGSTTGTITMIIYPHDVEDADKGNILVKFNADSIDATNGISGAIFGDSPTFSIVNTGISLLQDIMLAGASEKMEKSVSPSISRIQNYWSPVTYNTQASVNFIEENNPIKAAQTIAETVAAKQTAKQKTETSAKPKAKTKAKTKTKAKAKAEAKAEELVQTMPEVVQDVIEQIDEITPDAGINPVEPAAITAVQGNSELKTTEATTTEPSTKSTTTIILVILALCIAITGIVVGCKKRKILV